MGGDIVMHGFGGKVLPCLGFCPLDVDKDYDFIVAAHRETFALTFGYQIMDWQIEKELERERKNGVGVFLNNELIGICDVETRKFNNNVEYGWVHFFYLAQRYRGCGLAKQLITHAEEYCCIHDHKALYLRTGKNNTAAKKLYERHGFVLEPSLDTACEIGYKKTILGI